MVDEFDDLSNDEIERRLCTEAGHVAAGECRLLLLIGAFERRGAWAGPGLLSCAHWLNWRCGTSLGAAREQVRVARALNRLPLVREAFGAGRISYSKVRAITRVADPKVEAPLLEMAGYATASQLENIVRNYRRADPGEGKGALDRHDCRYFRSRTDEDGMLIINARLSPEDGAVVLATIETARRAQAEARSTAGEEAGATAEDVPAETPAPDDVSAETCQPAEGPGDDWEHDRADALVGVCESVLRSGLAWDPERPTVAVLVHVDENVAADPALEGCSHVDGVGALAAHTAVRLACDAAVSRLVFRAGGVVEQVGATRVVPTRMRRAVLARDRGCRWPGCTRERFVDVHHVRFVSAGGPTKVRNLVTICRRHHRLVHEGGYRLAMSRRGAVRVWDPSGRDIPVVPAAVAPAGPDLITRNRQAGIRIHPTTLAYDGSPFDMGLTIDALLCQARKMELGLPDDYRYDDWQSDPGDGEPDRDTGGFEG